MHPDAWVLLEILATHNEVTEAPITDLKNLVKSNSKSCGCGVIARRTNEILYCRDVCVHQCTTLAVRFGKRVEHFFSFWYLPFGTL